MPPKRKASGPSEVPSPSASSRPTKKARTSTAPKDELTLDSWPHLTREDLEGFPKEALVDYILQIQAKELAVETASVEEDAGKLAAQASKLAGMMASGIKKQMKWQPSCKTGGKKWEYSSMVPSEAVFNELFNFKLPMKAWKQKKIPLKDFTDITGGISASIRYGYLGIVSENITLRWDKEALSFSVSGLYGL